MMRSLYSAVSGLKSHQTRMDVIGNNIANVNTEAFKSSSVTFSELMYQTTSYASGGNGATGTGGVNAKQIGLGTSVGSTYVSVETAGSAETTGNPFDIRLSDSKTTNFFIVSDGTSTFFTRAGSFYVDGNGYLCMTSTGYTVMGWQVDPDTGDIRKDTVSALQVMSAANQISAPEATTKATVSGVLDKNDTNLDTDEGYVMTLGFYDDLGYAYTAKFSVKPSTDEENNNLDDGTYRITLTDIVDSESNSIFAEYELMDEQEVDGETNHKQTQLDLVFAGATITYNTDDGTFIQIEAGTDDDYDGAVDTANTAQQAVNENVLDADGNPTLDYNGILLNLENITATGDTNTENDGTGTGSNFSNITVDFSTSTNYNNSGTSTMKSLKGDSDGDGTGKKLGALIGLSVSQDGTIYGSYDNGNTVLLCQIAAAQFANASGLEKVGDNCYKTTLNSGEFDGIGVAIDADGSSMNSGEIEMSNVDLSTEFTDMIITQRGFQANSRVITVSDTLLEELINLKRS